MIDVAHVLLGAALVAIGILATALADRIRGLHVARKHASATGPTRASIEVVDPELVPAPRRESRALRR